MEVVAVEKNALKLASTADLAVIQQFEPIVSLEGEDFDERSASLVIRYTIEVHQSEFSIRNSARNLCVSLYKCREAFIEGSANKTSSGWGVFCDKNFKQIGMSDGNIRAAIRCGESLVKHERQHPEASDLFNRLSRAALFALGGNEETLVTVQQVLASNPEANVTAADVRRLSDQVNQEKVRRLEAERRSDAFEQTNAALNDTLEQKREQVAALRERAELAEQRAKTPVEGIVFKLPAGVSSEEELRHQLQQKNSQLQSEQERLESSVVAATTKLTEVQRALSTSEQIKNVLVDLESDLQIMRAKYTRGMVEKMTSGTPAVKERLKGIANELRAMANAIDVD